MTDWAAKHFYRRSWAGRILSALLRRRTRPEPEFHLVIEPGVGVFVRPTPKP